MGMQSILTAIYPTHCLGCDATTDTAQALCGSCWRDTWFIQGLVCDQCGVPLMGDDTESTLRCDECISMARPWRRGRATIEYRDKGRALVLALKHGDRTELAKSVGAWMARAGQAIVDDNTLIVPVPLHWTRLLKRRYNQSALLAGATAKILELPHIPDALLRVKKTISLDGHSRDERFAALQGAIVPNPKRASELRGENILLVDDVMTTGATLAASAEALNEAGVGDISVLTLARVTKDT